MSRRDPNDIEEIKLIGRTLHDNYELGVQLALERNKRNDPDFYPIAKHFYLKRPTIYLPAVGRKADDVEALRMFADQHGLTREAALEKLAPVRRWNESDKKTVWRGHHGRDGRPLRQVLDDRSKYR